LKHQKSRGTGNQTGNIEDGKLRNEGELRSRVKKEEIVFEKESRGRGGKFKKGWRFRRGVPIPLLSPESERESGGGLLTFEGKLPIGGEKWNLVTMVRNEKGGRVKGRKKI